MWNLDVSSPCETRKRSLKLFNVALTQTPSDRFPWNIIVKICRWWKFLLLFKHWLQGLNRNNHWVDTSCHISHDFDMDFPCDMGWASSQTYLYIYARNNVTNADKFKTLLLKLDLSRISDIDSKGNNKILVKLWSTMRWRTTPWFDRTFDTTYIRWLIVERGNRKPQKSSRGYGKPFSLQMESQLRHL